MVIENDPECEEYSIWGDEVEIPIGNDIGNNMTQFLELMNIRQIENIIDKTPERPV